MTEAGPSADKITSTAPNGTVFTHRPDLDGEVEIHDLDTSYNGQGAYTAGVDGNDLVWLVAHRIVQAAKSPKQIERWNARAGERLPSDPRIEAFLDEIEQVCRKHGMTISHEDPHGNFEIEDFGGDPIAGSPFGPVANVGEYNIRWLRAASDNRSDPTKSSPGPCQSCKRPEGAVNHVPGHVFVGFGVGWQLCPMCRGSGVAMPKKRPDGRTFVESPAALETDIVDVGEQRVTLPRSPR